jgi:hypothetical protein
MAGITGPGLVRLARGFAGAWPYLELIAAASGIADPLDGRVVEAYWVGNHLLDNVRMPKFGGFLDERFRGAPSAAGTASPRRSRRARSRTAVSTSFSCTRGLGCCARVARIRRCGFSTAAGSAGGR